MADAKKNGLSAAQLAKMREILVARRTEIFDDARGWSDESDVGSASGDEGDLASAAVTADLTFKTRARESELLQKIEYAIEKIDAGSYGKCIECENPIPMARLEALPFAELCIDCQERFDEQGSMAGSATDRFEIT